MISRLPVPRLAAAAPVTQGARRDDDFGWTNCCQKETAEVIPNLWHCRGCRDNLSWKQVARQDQQSRGAAGAHLCGLQQGPWCRIFVDRVDEGSGIY